MSGTWIYVAIGGAVGSTLRYGLSGWLMNRSAGTFPWGTLAVNVLGCVAMGVLGRLLFESVARPELRMGILVGLLGGFTTFSTFSFETLQLVNDRQFGSAAIYVLLTNAGCLSGVWLACRLVEKVQG
jgi:CrcB protein